MTYLHFSLYQKSHNVVIKNINTMKNLLVLIVFTITSFFNSTAFSQDILVNPYNEEEVVLNENQTENFDEGKSFLLVGTNHLYWIEAYTFSPVGNKCINQSFIYTSMYFLSLLILFIFCFDFAFADKKWSLRNQIVVYLGILIFSLIIAYIPFSWNFFSILVIGIISIIISALAILETALTGTSFRNAVIIMATALSIITYAISFNAQSVGFSYCFDEFILPLMWVMVIFLVARVIYTYLNNRTERKESILSVKPSKI